MKYLFTLLLITSLSSAAQAEKVPAPSSLIVDSAVTAIPRFNDFIASAVPGYTLISSDTDDFGIMYTYKYQKADGDEITISYTIKDKFGDPDMKIPRLKCVDNIEIHVQYLTQVAIYNKLFGTIYTPEDFKEKAEKGDHLFYGKDGVDFQTRSNQSSRGYWRMMFTSRNE